MLGQAVAAMLCVSGLIAATPGVAGAEPSKRFSSGVFRFSDGGAVGAGAARLVTNDAGATISVRTAELAAEPHTVWWVVFNHPEHCADPFAPGFQCGPGDLPFNGGDARVEFSLLYAAGNVVGNSGHAGFGGHLRTGDVSDATVGKGLVHPRGAEIHLVIRTHGPTIPHMVSEQIHTFNGGCEVGEPNQGLCQDVQFAAFAQ